MFKFMFSIMLTSFSPTFFSVQNYLRSAVLARADGLGLAKLGLRCQIAEVDHADAEGRTPLNRCLFHNWKIPDAQYAAHTAIAGLLVGHGASYDLFTAAASS